LQPPVENAAAFGALLIFAEHRYYGQSLPLGAETFNNMHFLTHEQALADYATLIQEIKPQVWVCFVSAVTAL